MKVELCNFGRIKITLSESDLIGLKLTVNTLTQPTYMAKLTLLALYKVAADKLKLDTASTDILIEAYPHLSGGVFYFTPLKTAKKKFLAVKSSPLYAYDFFDGNDLFLAIETLYNNPGTRKTYSKIYDIDGVFRLVTEFEPYKICEFCDQIRPFCDIKKHTCEHGRALTGDNAIYEIGEKLTKPLGLLPPP